MIVDHQGKKIEFRDEPTRISLSGFCEKSKEVTKGLIEQQIAMPTAPEMASLLHAILMQGRSKFRLDGDWEGSFFERFMAGYCIFQNTLIIYDFTREKKQGFDIYYLDMPNIDHFDNFFQKRKNLVSLDYLRKKLKDATKFKVEKNEILISRDRCLRCISALDEIGKYGDTWGSRDGEDPRDPVHNPELVGIYMGRQGNELENVIKLKEIYHEWGLGFLCGVSSGSMYGMKEETKYINKGRNEIGIYQSAILQAIGCRFSNIIPVRNAIGRFMRISKLI